MPETGPDPTDAADAWLATFLARRRELCGERRLFLAVFMGALDDLRRYGRDAKAYAAAYRWLLSDEDTWPLSFRPACAELGLDAEAVRRRVLAALAAQRAVLPGPAPQHRGRKVPILLLGAA